MLTMTTVITRQSSVSSNITSALDQENTPQEDKWWGRGTGRLGLTPSSSEAR